MVSFIWLISLLFYDFFFSGGKYPNDLPRAIMFQSDGGSGCAGCGGGEDGGGGGGDE